MLEIELNVCFFKAAITANASSSRNIWCLNIIKINLFDQTKKLADNNWTVKVVGFSTTLITIRSILFSSISLDWISRAFYRLPAFNIWHIFVSKSALIRCLTLGCLSVCLWISILVIITILMWTWWQVNDQANSIRKPGVRTRWKIICKRTRLMYTNTAFCCLVSCFVYYASNSIRRCWFDENECLT